MLYGYILTIMFQVGMGEQFPFLVCSLITACVYIGDSEEITGGLSMLHI